MGLANIVKVLRYTKPASAILKIQISNTVYAQTYFGFNLTEGTYALSYSSVDYIREHGTHPTNMAQPCFADIMGAKFSTWDQDNDDNPTMNCAAEAGGGWWFRHCNESCNLNLPKYNSANPGPVSYTKMRLGIVDLRYWRDYIYNFRLMIPQTLD